MLAPVSPLITVLSEKTCPAPRGIAGSRDRQSSHRSEAHRHGACRTRSGRGEDQDRNATAAERRAQQRTKARWARRPARRSYRRRLRDATELKQDHGDTLPDKHSQAEAARYRSPRNGWNNRRNEASRACPARDKTKTNTGLLILGEGTRIAAALFRPMRDAPRLYTGRSGRYRGRGCGKPRRRSVASRRAVSEACTRTSLWPRSVTIACLQTPPPTPCLGAPRRKEPGSSHNWALCARGATPTLLEAHKVA